MTEEFCVMRKSLDSNKNLAKSEINKHPLRVLPVAFDSDNFFTVFKAKSFYRKKNRRQITGDNCEQYDKTDEHPAVGSPFGAFETSRLKDARSPVKKRQQKHEIISGGSQPERGKIFCVKRAARMFEIADEQQNADKQKREDKQRVYRIAAD